MSKAVTFRKVVSKNASGTSSGGGGGTLTGSGTANISTRWLSATSLGNGSISDTGIYLNTSIPMGWNTPTPLAWMHITSTNNTSSTSSIRVDSSTVTNMFWVRDDGFLNIQNGFYLGGTPFLKVTNIDSLYIGALAGGNVTTGDAENVAVGWNSLGKNTSGSSNMALGTSAGADNTTGTFNVYIGRSAGYSSSKNVTGSRHICIGGLEAGKDISSGFDDIFIGYQSGVGISNGNVNTAIGNFISYTSSISNSLAIGYVLSMDNSTDVIIGNGGVAYSNFYLGGSKYFNGAAPVIIQPSSCILAATDTSVTTSTLTIAGARGRGTGDGSPIIFSTAAAGSTGNTWNPLVEAMRITTKQQVSIGGVTSSAALTLPSGTATAGTAPLKLTSGTNLTSVEAGAVEFDGTNYFASTTARYTLAKTLTATATLDFPSTLPAATSDLTVTVTGAALNDVVAIGIPNGSIASGASFFGWVSATNTVTVRFINNTGINIDPASGTYRVSVLKY